MTNSTFMLELERVFAYDGGARHNASVPGECVNTPRHMASPYTPGADMSESIAPPTDVPTCPTRGSGR